MKKWSFNRHRGEGMVLSLLLLLAVLCCSALGQLGQVDMRRVTESLGQTFEEIKRYGLGVDALQAEYLRVGFTFSRLDNIDDLLSDTRAQEAINNVLSLFGNITSDDVSSTTPLEIHPATNCCEIDLTGQSNPQACCHSCTSADNDTVTAIAEGFRGAGLEGVELEFGSSSGTFLRFPASAPEEDCSQEDARLLPWYIDITRSRPREIVILLDLTTRSGFPGFPAVTLENLDSLRTAAQEVLDSLTAQDKAGVVAISGSLARNAPVNSLAGVVPVCETNRNRLSTFINDVSDGETPGNYTFGFTLAFRQLSNDTSSDKLILFFTTGVDMYGEFDQMTLGFDHTPILEVVTRGNSERTLNSTIISVFRLEDSSTADIFFNPLVNQPMVLAGTITTLDTENTVATYYSPLLSNSPPTNEILLTRQINNNGENSLSISQVWFNGSTLVGVLHAVIPWQQLFGYIDPFLENRDSSYVLVFTGDGQALLHPLLPGNIQSDVQVSDVETEGEIASVLNMLMSQSSVTREFQKQILISTGSRDPSGFVQRTVPATYHCRDLGITGTKLHVCLVVADEDVVTVVQNTEDPTGVYQGRREAPVYHNTELSVPEEDQCNYFCKTSVSNQISFQLTDPNRPPDEDTLSQVQEITTYIEEGGTPPSWINGSVASNVAINSIVAESWMNMTGGFNDYISRRHLVTPSGVYLSYPPSHLDREFQPDLTEWFASSSAHTSILTLTPPRTDSLMEGGQVYSLGYVLRAPQDQSDMDLGDRGQLLSVVAADATLSSLRVILLETLALCEESDISCFLIDDRGNLVYHPDLLEGGYEGGPIFFADQLIFSEQRNNRVFSEHFPILTDLLVKGLSSKLQCVDHFDSDIRLRRFFSFDFSSDLTYSNLNDADSCVRYMLRHIPGTNAFFGITQMVRDCSNFLCFCVPDCFNCDTAPVTGCECPCTCSENCLLSRGTPPCPMVSTEDANYDAVPRPDSTNLPYCFNQSCGCREDLQSCVGVRECYWCETEGRCVHNTECCSDANGVNCCEAEERFSSLPSCLEEACSQDVVPPNSSVCPTEPSTEPSTTPITNATSPTSPTSPTTPPDVVTPDSNATSPTTSTGSSSSSNDTAIVAGVVGGIVGLILILLLGGFIVWYQFFRAADPEEDISKESAFDFSHKRHEAVNPTAVASNENVLGEERVQESNKGGSSAPDETTL